jgi:hypothetical protein
MKGLILFIIIILIFLGCAMVGYNLASQSATPTPQPLTESTPLPASEQHNYVLIRADRLDSSEPKLISVWFVSIFFLENNPTQLSLAQIYPAHKTTSKSEAMMRKFTLNDQGEPSDAFWKAVRGYGFNWEGYFLIDTQGANKFLEWLVGNQDFMPTLEEASRNLKNSRSLADQTCKAVISSSSKEIGQFDWSVIVPDHLRTNIRFENGLALWDRITENGNPARCNFLPSP